MKVAFCALAIIGVFYAVTTQDHCSGVGNDQVNPMRAESIVLLLVTASACFAADPANLVAPLKDQSAIRGCQWNASTAAIGPGFIFLAEWDESRILMNIDGMDVELRVVADAGTRPSRRAELVKAYRSTGIEVRATYRVTWDCSQSDNPEACEVTRYDVTYEVHKGGRSQVVNASGEVGC